MAKIIHGKLHNKFAPFRKIWSIQSKISTGIRFCHYLRSYRLKPHAVARVTRHRSIEPQQRRSQPNVWLLRPPLNDRIYWPEPPLYGFPRGCGRACVCISKFPGGLFRRGRAAKNFLPTEFLSCLLLSLALTRCRFTSPSSTIKCKWVNGRVKSYSF